MATQGRAVTTVLIAVLGLLLAFFYASPAQCQSIVSFSPADEFAIPSGHGAVRFAFNGTYSSATLNGETWEFTDLTIDESQRSGNLKVAVENSNITILYYRTGSQFLLSARLTYTAEGNGSQIINLCLNNTQPTHSSEWSVIVPDSVFLAEGEGWRLLPDDSVVISGIVGNVTLVHYSFQTPNASDQPFYMQHSVGLTAAAVVAATVAVVLAIKYRVRR
jgi:hypothetical protein